MECYKEITSESLPEYRKEVVPLRIPSGTKHRDVSGYKSMCADDVIPKANLFAQISFKEGKGLISSRHPDFCLKGEAALTWHHFHLSGIRSKLAGGKLP